jgi:hypothetical protein
VKTLATIEVGAGELYAWRCSRITTANGGPMLLIESPDSKIAVSGQPADIQAFARSLDMVVDIAGKAVMQ